jgi:hypothetical protein
VLISDFLIRYHGSSVSATALDNGFRVVNPGGSEAPSPEILILEAGKEGTQGAG